MAVSFFIAGLTPLRMRYAFGEIPTILHQNLRGKGKWGGGSCAGKKGNRRKGKAITQERKRRKEQNLGFCARQKVRRNKKSENCKNPLDKWEILRYNLIVSVR